MSESRHRPLGSSGTMLAIWCALLWAGTGVANQFAVDDVPPLLVGAVRFALAALFMLAWCRWEGAPLAMTREQWRPVLVMALLLVAQIGTFNIGGKLSTASHASLYVNTYIFWVAAAEHFVLRTLRLGRRQWVGLFIAAIAVAVLLLSDEMPDQSVVAGPDPRDRPTPAGDLLLLISGLILGAKVVFTKVAVKTVPPGTLIFWHDLLGGILFLAISLIFEPFPTRPPSRDALVALLFSGIVVSGFCFAANAWQLRRHGASQISVFSFTTPLFGVALGVVFRGDQLSPWLLASGLAVAIGITMVLGERRPVDVVD